MSYEQERPQRLLQDISTPERSDAESESDSEHELDCVEVREKNTDTEQSVRI